MRPRFLVLLVLAMLLGALIARGFAHEDADSKPSRVPTVEEVFTYVGSACDAITKDGTLPVRCKPLMDEKSPTLMFLFPDITMFQTLIPILMHEFGDMFCNALVAADLRPHVSVSLASEQQYMVYSCTERTRSPWMPWEKQETPAPQEPQDAPLPLSGRNPLIPI